MKSGTDQDILTVLCGTQIPPAARITALADVYDALTSKRVYKDAVSHSEAIAITREGRGSQFDPDIVDAFFRIESKCAGIIVDSSGVD
jgi:putative two-component system response regulator